MIKNIAIFGLGVVGGAFQKALMARGFDGWTLRVDPRLQKSHTPKEFRNVEIAFICVPTPTLQSGLQDLSAICSTLRFLCEAKVLGFDGLACIRSTVTPENVRFLQRAYPLNITTLPEFLTEANAEQDSYESLFFVVGACGEHSAILSPFLAELWPDSKMKHTTPAGAMMFKYLVNNHLAVRISVTNELKLYWDAHGDTAWKEVTDLILLEEKRLGCSHYGVPGPDGKLGFGGKCFPKDLKAIAACSFLDGALCGALRINDHVRGDDNA